MKMIRLPRLMVSPVAACVGLAATAASGQGTVTVVGGPRFATPAVVVSPKFPAIERALDQEVRVDISGSVLPDGTFKAETVTSENGEPAFIAAVTEVLSCGDSSRQSTKSGVPRRARLFARPSGSAGTRRTRKST
jgi:hypothetical protein